MELINLDNYEKYRLLEDDNLRKRKKMKNINELKIQEVNMLLLFKI